MKIHDDVCPGVTCGMQNCKSGFTDAMSLTGGSGKNKNDVLKHMPDLARNKALLSLVFVVSAMSSRR